MSENEKVGMEPEFPESCHNSLNRYKISLFLKISVLKTKCIQMTLSEIAFSPFTI